MALSSRNVGIYGQVKMFYKKQLAEKTATIKKIQYSLLGSEFAKTDIAKKPTKYQELDEVYEFDKQEDGDR